ncbi:response regulator [Flavobacterium sp.]|uniref:response regulator n=1 Tax=Flavobacterium sp. TaxID=239 RepID=UPI00374FED1B
MKKFHSTYIIDDDLIFVLLFKKIIEKSMKFDEIKNFTDAELVIEELNDNYKNNKKMPDIIFLDLNMPNIDGWQFLESIKNCPFSEQLNIYVVSSTIDNSEITRAKKYKNVKKFISKPIALDFFESYEI